MQTHGLHLCSMITFITVFLGSSLSQAQVAEDDGYKHDGFFLRLSAGAAFARNSIKDGGVEEAVQGGGSSFDVAVGATITENFALHAEIFGAGLVDPQVYQDGTEKGQLEGEYTLGAFGAGVTYYFMPANFYLSAAVGLSIIKAEIGNQVFESDAGVAANLMFGKEWWVHRDWGIGIAGQLIYSAIPSGLDNPHHTVIAGVLFSATFN